MRRREIGIAEAFLFYGMLNGEQISTDLRVAEMLQNHPPEVDEIMSRMNSLPKSQRRAAFDDFVSTLPDKVREQLLHDIQSMRPTYDTSGALIL